MRLQVLPKVEHSARKEPEAKEVRKNDGAIGPPSGTPRWAAATWTSAHHRLAQDAPALRTSVLLYEAFL